MENEEIKKNLQNSNTWLRGFYMFLFIILYGIAETLIIAISLFQFAHHLIGKSPNQRLLEFGKSTSIYIYEIMQYLTYNSEKKPFPLSEWPSDKSIVDK